MQQEAQDQDSVNSEVKRFLTQAVSGLVSPVSDCQQQDIDVSRQLAAMSRLESEKSPANTTKRPPFKDIIQQLRQELSSPNITLNHETPTSNTPRNSSKEACALSENNCAASIPNPDEKKAKKQQRPSATTPAQPTKRIKMSIDAVVPNTTPTPQKNLTLQSTPQASERQTPSHPHIIIKLPSMQHMKRLAETPTPIKPTDFRFIDEFLDVLSGFDLENTDDHVIYSQHVDLMAVNAFLARLIPANKPMDEGQIDSLKTLIQVANDILSKKELPSLKSALSTDAAEKSTEEMVQSVKYACFHVDLANAILAASVIGGFQSDEVIQAQIFSQEMIEACINTIKEQLMNTVAFVLEEETKLTGPDEAIGQCISDDSFKSALSRLCISLQSTLQMLVSFMEHEQLSEPLLILCIYASLSVFQLDLSTSLLFIPIHVYSVQSAASNILEHIFANSLDHRAFILEEVQSCMTKFIHSNSSGYVFKLLNGKSIHPLSALAFKLLQSAPMNKVTNGNIAKAFRMHSNPEASSEDKNSSSDQMQKSLTSICDQVNACINHFWKSMIMACFSKEQDQKKSVDIKSTEVKHAFETIASDALTILLEKEWPVAESLVFTLARWMFQVIDDDKKSGSDVHVKQVAIQWMADAYKKIFAAKRDYADVLADAKRHPNMDTVRYLAFRDLDDSKQVNHKSVEPFYAHYFLNAEPSSVLPADQEEKDKAFFLDRIVNLSSRDKGTVLRDLVNTQITTDDHRLARFYFKLVFLGKPVCHQLPEVIMTKIVKCVNSDLISLRTKAMRLSQEIAMMDPTFLKNKTVFELLLARLTDPSPSVRDATVDLLSKVVLADDALVSDYYPLLSERVMDVSVSVRKRAVRLLKDVYQRFHGELSRSESRLAADVIQAKQNTMKDAVIKMLQRTRDEEDTVSELSVKLLTTLFTDCIKAIHDSNAEYTHLTILQRRDLQFSSHIIRLVCESSPSNGDLFGEFLIDLGRNEDTQGHVQELEAACFYWLECFVDNLIRDEMTELQKSNVITTCYQISRAYPKLLAKHISTFIPYVQTTMPTSPPRPDSISASLKKEQHVQSIIMLIQVSVPFLKNPDLNLMETLEIELVKWINRGTLSVVSSISCLCSLVQNVTNNRARIEKIMTACFDLLVKSRQTLMKCTGGSIDAPLPKGMLPITIKSLLILGRFARHYTLLEHIKKDELMALFMDFARFDKEEKVAAAGLSALGQFLVQYAACVLQKPVLSLLSSAAGKAKGKSNLLLKTELLKFLHEFVTCHDYEEKKDNNKTKPVDTATLIGKGDDLTEGGITSALMQTFLSFVLGSLFDSDVHVFMNSFKLFHLILEQGLVHPLVCIPHLVALETHPDSKIRGKALSVHAKLFHKHVSFMNAKNMECIEVSFQYHQSRSKKLHVPGTRLEVCEESEQQVAVALLAPMYQLLQTSKRQKRNEFLTMCCSLFDLHAIDAQKSKSSRKTLQFMLYVAENLSALPFKTTDEVILTLNRLRRVFASNSTFHDENNSLPVLLLLSCLQTYLMDLYGIQDHEFVNYQPVTNKTNEKPTHRRAKMKPFSLALYGISEDALLDTNQWDTLRDKFADITGYEVGETVPVVDPEIALDDDDYEAPAKSKKRGRA